MDDFSKLRIPVEKDFTEPSELYDKLIATVRTYRPKKDLEIVDRAYAVAKKAHEGQLRKSGEPYIIHPLNVALILADLRADTESICGGILHDVVEDTVMTTGEVAKEFGDEVALLVDGVTKLTQINYTADKVEVQAENLSKMFLAMAKDIRVIIIKLADRLHNMRTMQYQQPHKQYEKSRETMDIYAPIAQRLGISKVKVELDDLSLRYLEPQIYADLSEKVNAKLKEKENFINEIVAEVSEHLEEANIKGSVYGRVKHLFSIYKKMVNQNKILDQVYDLFAIRILVESDKDCYAALGVMHEMYKPIPGRIKDYIAMPKPNGYKSLHTTLINRKGQTFEVQIRTYEMHEEAEYGIAAHWKYKAGPSGTVTPDAEEEKLTWLRQILEWQQEMSDNNEFLSLLKNDLNLFSDSVYCFTPKGDVKNLPAGSTPVDFAYSIHSAVGNKMVGARVNNKLVTLDYQIQNGDQIDIITSQNSKGPSRDWLKIVKSTQAKNKINQWFKTEFKEENVEKGRDLMLSYCKAKGITLSDYLKPEYMEPCIKKYGYKEWDSIYAAIGHGALKEGQVVNRLIEEYEKHNRKELTNEQVLEGIGEISLNKQNNRNFGGVKSSIVVQGIHDMAVHFSRCCSPVPGDEIIGFVTRGRGVSVHRTDCINIINLSEEDRGRLIPAEWDINEEDQSKGEFFQAEITLYTKNRNGVLFDVSRILSENMIDITSMNVRTSKQGTATITVGINIHNTRMLNSIISKLRNVEGLIDIERSMG